MSRTRIIGLMLKLVLGCGCGTEPTNTKGGDVGADDKQATLPRNMTEEELKAELSEIMMQKETFFQEGVALADAWLSRLDHGEYAASWSESSSLLRETISREMWVVTCMGRLQKSLESCCSGIIIRGNYSNIFQQ